MPLRYLIRNCPITKFEISVTNADGSRKSESQMEAGHKDSKSKTTKK